MFPIIPILCWAAALGGCGGLLWYASLSKDDKADADRIAADYASTLYNRAVDQLTDAQAKHVNGLVKRHFDG